MLSSQLVSLIGQAAHEQPPPIIDFDGTIALQFVLFLAMYYVLKQFVFLPYLKVRALREKSTFGAKEDAKLFAEKARQLQSGYAHLLTEAKAEIEKERLQLYQNHQLEHQEKWQQAKQSMETQAVAEGAEVDAQAENARRSLHQQVPLFAETIASKIAGREVPK